MFTSFEKKLLWGCLMVFAAIYLRGLFLDIMDVDAAQYASIAMEMLQNGSWLEVKHRGGDYLDKPPLLFWASAGSYALFGLGNAAYKLPSFLAAMFGVYALWAFAKLYYDRATARNAALIFFSAQALVLICNDVRTDTLLLGFGTAAVWQLAVFLEKKRWKNLFFASIWVGLAMLAKGPIGLIMPVFAVGTHLVLRRRWSDFLRWEWLVGLGLAGLVLLPMSWGLYHQFNLHPEKTVNGKTGVSGLYFYFWEQSFGRITGENVWENDTSPFYFVHTYIWAFLPWSFLLLGALFSRFSRLFKEKCHIQIGDEGYSIGGFVLTFIALSMSKYKLPHYIFITLPWAAVLVARFLKVLFENERNKQQKLWVGLQYFTFFAMLLVAGLLVFYVFPNGNVLWGIGFLVATLGLVFYFFQKRKIRTSGNLVLQSILVAALCNVVINFFFYPQVLSYQGTAKAMSYARTKGKIPMENLYLFDRHAHTMDVYGQRIFENFPKEGMRQKLEAGKKPIFICTNENGLNRLGAEGLKIEKIKAFPQYQVALLKGSFLNPKTRESVLDSIFLLKVQP